jgi:hypothetical protein
MDIRYLLQNGVFYLEGLALLCSLIFLKKYIHTPAKVIPLYLMMVFVIEYMGSEMADDQWLYNILGMAELLTFTYIFYGTAKGKGSKKIVLSAFLIGAVFLIIDAFLITETFYEFLSNGFGFVSIGIAVMGFVFLLEMAQSDKIIHQNRILLYWVVIGLLIFHLCNLPVTVLTNDLFEIGNVDNILIILSVAGISMYSCYIIGFIWSRKEWN